ncbi:sensor domain-containing diguanylate cyclase [Tepidibacter formicigenes]|jgi:diguanylate cyclase (GGDEF)-like protein/PAS domain S-box-containing protein|uniref:PAS domain S-box-containing protein/diguanylate cyclase (GGDEF) domain-containing protein n=1 Tax=Tepidibacter formicigenes DSM 15518 TaxID=1123349 RepID=A0A1M6LHW8_9FIRM|nr:sensor domain-containing diguanylate cyclase [Tepidibacter formicigenes]SHJ70758.1 PAS domain S-box-containing protein/diguanylate cyclase (GGDEF) domain-containing protein [Tepidibacter formicigenes DSM 15518]
MKDYFLVENMQNAFAYHKIILDKDKKPIDYEYIYVNSAFENLTGLKRSSILGKKVTEVITEIEKSGFNLIEYYSDIALNAKKDEIVQYFDIWDKWYKIYVYSPKKGYFVTIFNDITDIKKIEEKSKNQKEIMTQITQGIEEIVFLESIDNKEILYVNDAFKKYVNFDYEEIKANPRIWTKMLHPYDKKMVDSELTLDNMLKELETKKIIKKELRIKTDHGMKWIKAKITPVYNSEGKIYRIVGIGQDITDEKKLRQKLKRALSKTKRLAMYDELTNLYNRRAFWKEANKEIQRIIRNGGKLVIIMADIDNFKEINDTYGHDVGDKVLKHFSNILKINIRKYDIVARLGGEEFVILLKNVGKEEGLKKSEKVRKQIEKNKVFIKSTNKNIKYTVSFGISEITDKDNYSIEKAIKRADCALYKSKEQGRNKSTCI